MDNVPWHSLDSEGVTERLETSAVHGLESGEAERRLQKFGLNELKEKKRITVLEIFVHQFKSLVVLALFIAAALSFFMGEYVDVAVIIAILLINAAIGTFQEYRAEKALEALKKMSATSARVIRDGMQHRIYARDIVPGDVFLLEVGDRVPADGRIIEAVNLALNESMFTGESASHYKTVEPLAEDVQLLERSNMAYKSTIVVNGRAKLIATATGTDTEVGRIAGILQETAEVQTPLQKRLSEFMKMLGKYTVAGVLLVVILGMFVANFGAADIIKTAVAQAVSFIPEGLPIVVTIVLAVGVGAMAARNAIIRKLPAVETLGCVTAICTDKTGTLTKNEMTVKRIYADGELIHVTGDGYSTAGEFMSNGHVIDPHDRRWLVRLLRIGILCNDAELERKDGGIEVIGDPTEGALIVAGEKMGLEKVELDSVYGRTGEIQFSPEKKFMATFNRKRNGILVANVKGAPERIIGMCSHAMIGGKKVRLTKAVKARIMRENTKMTKDTLRVLGFAYREVKSESEDELKGMVFVGLAGMFDPPREEAKESIAACMESGIKVIMITGDHKLTAMGIARELGMINEGNGSRVMTGEELDRIDDAQLEDVIGEVVIYARTTSEHKMRIVNALKRKGHVVAMTGDGINDALAVKNADIGIAMGISGTEITKESSDMVITDDRFSTIVAAVEEGRGVYVNLKKVISYLIATNLGEVLLLFMILLSGLFMPEALPLALLPVHILWVNLLTDGVCDVTLAMEPKEKGLMKHRPRRPTEQLITRDMGYFIITSAVIIALGTLGVFYYEYQNGSVEHARTMAFTTLVAFQLFSALNVRSSKSVLEAGLFSNMYLVAALIFSVLALAAAVYIPFLNDALYTTPLTLWDWALAFGVASSLLILYEIKKFTVPHLAGIKYNVRRKAA